LFPVSQLNRQGGFVVALLVAASSIRLRAERALKWTAPAAAKTDNAGTAGMRNRD